MAAIWKTAAELSNVEREALDLLITHENFPRIMAVWFHQFPEHIWIRGRGPGNWEFKLSPSDIGPIWCVDTWKEPFNMGPKKEPAPGEMGEVVIAPKQDNEQAAPAMPTHLHRRVERKSNLTIGQQAWELIALPGAMDGHTFAKIVDEWIAQTVTPVDEVTNTTQLRDLRAKVANPPEWFTKTMQQSQTMRSRKIRLEMYASCALNGLLAGRTCAIKPQVDLGPIVELAWKLAEAMEKEQVNRKPLIPVSADPAESEE